MCKCYNFHSLYLYFLIGNTPNKLIVQFSCETLNITLTLRYFTGEICAPKVMKIYHLVTKKHSESNVTKLIENFDFKYLPEDIGTILRFLVVVGCVGGVF